MYQISYNKRTTFDKITVKTKYTDGPKFADPSMSAVSPYFKRSMVVVTNQMPMCDFLLVIFMSYSIVSEV